MSALQHGVVEVHIANVNSLLGLGVDEVNLLGPSAACVGIAHVAHLPADADPLARRERGLPDGYIAHFEVGARRALDGITTVGRAGLDIVAVAVSYHHVAQRDGVDALGVEPRGHRHGEVEQHAAASGDGLVAHIHDYHPVAVAAHAPHRYGVAVGVAVGQRGLLARGLGEGQLQVELQRHYVLVVVHAYGYHHILALSAREVGHRDGVLCLGA